MLLFKKEHIKPILSGLKTQTRRCWSRRRVIPGTIHKAKTLMLSKDYFAKLRILDLQVKSFDEAIFNISLKDARAEGYLTKEAFILKFFEINKTRIDSTKYFLLDKIWIVTFEVVKDE